MFSAGVSYRHNFINPAIKHSTIFGNSGASGEFFQYMENGSHHYFSIDTKFYAGNSFYVKTGLGYTFKDTTKGYASSSAFVFPLAIGNILQWETISFGVEWFGVRVPFGVSLSVGSEGLGDIDIESKKYKESAFLWHLIKGATLFTFSLGVAL